MEAAQKIVKYIKSQRGKDLLLANKPQESIKIFCDAD